MFKFTRCKVARKIFKNWHGEALFEKQIKAFPVSNGMNDNKKIEEVLNRGVDEIINRENLEKRLKSGQILRIKFGIDPTSPDLHLGHSIPLRKLKQLQDLGQHIIFLIGDFTAKIGDPSGRIEARKPLTELQINNNMKDYVKQAAKILNIRKVEIRRNSEWYKKKKAMFFLELTSRFTFARVIERDDFKKRIKEDIDVTMLELIYPLLQGYDSVELKADVEIGGRDQKFNLLMGRKVQKRYGQSPQDIITVPLLEGTDGVKKMSKSYGNYIGLGEPAFKMYGEIMSIPDSLIWKYFNLLTNAPLEKIEKMKEKINMGLLSPVDLKKELAREIVSSYYKNKEVEKAEREFEKVFKEKQAPTDIPTIKIENIPTSDNLTTFIFNLGLAGSKSDAQRLIQQKAVEIDGKIQTDWRVKPIIKKGTIIKVGKRKFVKLV